MAEHYAQHNANVARAVHQLGAESTAAFEGARDKVAAFIGAPSRDEIVFTKNSSEALNLVANTLAWADGRPGDRPRRRGRHHRDGAPLQHRPVAAADRAQGRDAALVRADRRRAARPVRTSTSSINERTKVVSLVWVSNMLGTVNPVAEIARRAHEVGAIVVLDASQAVPQLPVDVVASGADLRRLHRSQGRRPDRHRRALGQGGAPRRAAARSSAAAR